jgi:glycerophosphoryl diester phosphodiesterase
MTAILLEDARHPLRALRTSAGFAPGALPRLARFALTLLLRVLLIAAPFLAIAGVAYLMLLGEYDINYYLSQRPPEFLAAGFVIGIAALGLALVLVDRLSGWAVALHLTVFDGVPSGAAFRDSRRMMQGHRLFLIGRLAIWLGIRMAAAAVIVFFMGIVVAELPGLLANRLALLSGALIAAGLVWSALNALLNAIANGALSDILNDEFTRVLEGRAPRAMRGTSVADRRRAYLALGAVAILSLGSLGLGSLALDQVESDTTVEVIGHRGAAGSRPENTMASVLKAIEDGADWVEIDVQETADGEVIVAHDSDFMKLAGVGLKVWDATMADLAGIDIGSRFDPAYGAERTPTLRAVLEAAKGRGKVLIELKYYGHDEALESRVARIVEETGMADDVAVMSLKIPGVRKMQALRPDWPHGILAATAIGDLAALEADFLAVNTGQVSLHLIRQAHERGRKIYVWTVNDPLTMTRMISMGVDGLITDDPALARQVMEARNALSAPERLLLWLSDRFRPGSFDLVAEEADA